MSNSKYKRGDKILDNDYNQNNIEFNTVQNTSLDQSFSNEYLDYCKDPQEYDRKSRLEDHLVDIIEKSEFGHYLIEQRKFPKNYLSELYVFVHKNTDTLEWTRVEIINKTSEILKINLSQFFNAIPVKFKEELLNELNIDFQIFKNKKIGRLF
jgi:hypothetical protein